MRLRGVEIDEFEAFYARDKDRCLRAVVAAGLRPGEAEDAVAEAFARAFASWRRVRSTTSPAAWVVRTAVNANISWRRKRRREAVVPALPEVAVSDVDPRTDLLAAVRRLPARQREVVVLRYLLDLDTATTAASLGIAPGTVTAHLHRAVAALRDQLVDLEGTPS